MTVPENPAKVLEAQLAHRPDLQDLVDRNIIKDPKVAPAIQQHREELERRKIEDNLRHKIDHRPSPEELVEHNILKGKSHVMKEVADSLEGDPTEVAPALQKSRFELERNILHDNLEHKIQDRPDASKLVEQGILSEDQVPK